MTILTLGEQERLFDDTQWAIESAGPLDMDGVIAKAQERYGWHPGDVFCAVWNLVGSGHSRWRADHRVEAVRALRVSGDVPAQGAPSDSKKLSCP